MAQVNATIGKAHYATTITTATNTLVADEPVVHGGAAAGLAPEELLAASLASCTSITLRMYADRKQYAVDSIEVNVVVARDNSLNFTSIERKITIHGNITEDERTRLLEIANKCPVHKILSNQITINTHI
jgi:putative redox protein